MSARSIVLTGFMGTGKSALGKRLSVELGLPFVDLDARLRARFGLSIPEVFKQRGEQAFREAEAELCGELARGPAAVIATGGGALCGPASRRAFLDGGAHLVTLSTRLPVLLGRLEGGAGRPLLDGAGPLSARVPQLLAQRQGAYDAIWHRFDTSEGRFDELAAELAAELHLALALPPLIDLSHIAGGRGVNVLCGEALWERWPTLARLRKLDARPAHAIVDPQVAELHAAAIDAALGPEVTRSLGPESEAHKRLGAVVRLATELAASACDRGGLVYGIGGGVTTDVAGLVASLWMRGVPHVLIPTTLLAMVDAAIGGKTGVDLELGKNLLGTFAQPELVLIDPRWLATLPAEQLREGAAEWIKHGLIAGPERFAEVAPGPTALTLGAAAIARAAQVKVDIVSEDAHEAGRRLLLNLGHTFAHGFETLSGYTISHGRAVAAGLVAAAELGSQLGMTDPDLLPQLRGALEAWGLPTRLERSKRRFSHLVWEAMRHDKKRQRGRLRFIVPRALGDVTVVEDPPQAAVLEAIERVLGR